MAKFTWQDGTLVSKAKVEIDGTIYEVDPEEYSGATPLSANNLNAMQDGIYDDIGDLSNLNATNKTNIVNALNSLTTHTVNERVVGKWYDGNTLYEQCVEIGNLTNNAIKDVDLTTYGIDGNLVKKWEMYAQSSDGFKIDLSSSYMNMAGATQARALIYTGSSYNVLRVATTSDLSNYSAYVIIQYTKIAN